MKIVGASVTHKTFGTGTVIEHSDTRVTIDFNGQLKPFPYPGAFDGFLSACDSELQSSITDLIHEQKEKERLEKEAAQRREEALKLKRQTVGSIRAKNPPKRMNIAIKCTYCDGGRSKDVVGFSGICSKANMVYNVKTAKRTWCSDPTDSRCRKYLDGEMTRAELEYEYRNEGLCYESYMLEQWRAYAGRVQKEGERKGKPMKMKGVQRGSLCILTTRLPDDTGEGDRFIFGVFLIDEYFEGDERDEGYVSADQFYRLSLTPDEAKQMLYWWYHKNGNASEKPKWSQGLHRHINNEESALILRDIAVIKQDTEDAELAQEFYEHFCTINGTNPAELPEEAYGALTL